MAEVAAVIPCFRERKHILDVLAAMPEIVNRIFCVDDGCPDETGRLVESNCTDPRVRVIRNPDNGGVGSAVILGYQHALAEGFDVVVKIDGDGRMNPRDIPRLVQPIVEGAADYVKGNRFIVMSHARQMPQHRLWGNLILSFLNKLSSGYWRIFDPTNGFTAIHANVLRVLPLDRVARDYFFESDMLFHLATLRAVVRDVPQEATYAGETSHLSVIQVMPRFALKHCQNFFKRLLLCYFLRDFHLASIEWLMGPALLVFGVAFGAVQWSSHVSAGIEASAGTVMLSALPVLIGLQLTLSAIGFDIQNQPQEPIHRQLDDFT